MPLRVLATPLQTFGLRPDIDLDLMRPAQTLNGLCARLFDCLDGHLVEHRPDWLLVQGDTTTVMASSLAAFHRKVRVAHVEAGLRTGDFDNPFPEEMNRRIADLAASAHFAPTRRSDRRARRRSQHPARGTGRLCTAR